MVISATEDCLHFSEIPELQVCSIVFASADVGLSATGGEIKKIKKKIECMMNKVMGLSKKAQELK